MEVEPFEFFDKIPLKKGLEAAGVRVVPPGVVRYGAFVERGAVVTPSRGESHFPYGDDPSILYFLNSRRSGFHFPRGGPCGPW
jgi:hypothetical protein